MRKKKTVLNKTWKFLWHDDSLISWIISLVLAFIIVKFIIYPGLGLALGGTSHPVVAVVSGSMEHNGANFDSWWEDNKEWYTSNGINKEDFSDYIFRNGFNKGDIIVLYGSKSEDIKIGDVVVFQSNSHYPIIHRVVDRWSEDDEIYLKTKGDNNRNSYPELDETMISEDRVIGKSISRIPLLGWIKIGFTELLR
jgi:signal peptidase I